MDTHKLINLDKSEASVVRRRLQEWSNPDGQTPGPKFQDVLIKPLIQGLPKLQITDPRWVTNVYPLYYWGYEEVKKTGGARVYNHILESLPKWFSPSSDLWQDNTLRLHVRRIINSEIDIVVEDEKFFLFIEAKTPTKGQKIKFQNKRDDHQLVRQYIQGKILAEIIKKTFISGVIGANVPDPIPLGDTERTLLRLIGEERESLHILNLVWPPETESYQV